MRVAIIGSRNPKNMTIEKMAQHLPIECTEIISGGASGIDTLARKLAEWKKLPLVEILPDYDFFGKQAPLVRNTSIVKRADLVLAFWDFRSRGTAHTISECIRMNVAIQVISLEDC